MLSDRAARGLFDIRDNILRARKFTEGLTAESFKADDLRFYAVARCLEIVSRLPVGSLLPSAPGMSCRGAPSWI
jgi:hypothetical protein